MSNIIESKKADMESATVGRGSTFQLELDVELNGTTIRFVTAGIFSDNVFDH